MGKNKFKHGEELYKFKQFNLFNILKFIHI